MIARTSLICLLLAALLAGSGAVAQSTPPSRAEAQPVDACFVLARDDLRVDPNRLRKLQPADIERRLAGLTARAGRQESLRAMLACVMRRTDGR